MKAILSTIFLFLFCSSLYGQTLKLKSHFLSVGSKTNKLALSITVEGYKIPFTKATSSVPHGNLRIRVNLKKDTQNVSSYIPLVFLDKSIQYIYKKDTLREIKIKNDVTISKESKEAWLVTMTGTFSPDGEVLKETFYISHQEVMDFVTKLQRFKKKSAIIQKKWADLQKEWEFTEN